MHQDAKELVQKCDRCQRYKLVPTNYIPNESLAVHAVGNRPGRANTACYCEQKHDDHGNRLLHQMGRSRIHDNHDSYRHRSFHMEEHHLPIWHHQSIITDNGP
ncbi:hypothetical protein ACFX2F_002282 [Malus domestica]